MNNYLIKTCDGFLSWGETWEQIVKDWRAVFTGNISLEFFAEDNWSHNENFNLKNVITDSFIERRYIQSDPSYTIELRVLHYSMDENLLNLENSIDYIIYTVRPQNLPTSFWNFIFWIRYAFVIFLQVICNFFWVSEMLHSMPPSNSKQGKFS